MTQPADRFDELAYPFARAPQGAESVPVAPGVNWLRMPLPFSLDHINVWTLDEEGGYAIVDTGLATDEVRAGWDLVARARPEERVSRVVVTHLHPDHVGAAGWLCERHDCSLWMTRSEYLLARLLVADFAPPPPEAKRFYVAAGFDDEMYRKYARSFGRFGQYVSPLPAGYQRLSEGDRMTLAGKTWEVIIGRGHSPEHACLFSAELNVLIAGDQLLPRISSNVSVWPTEPDENPLADWLASCRMLIDRLPADVLVLPAHNEPFRGAHLRLRALIDEHEQRLERLEAFCSTPRRVIDTFDVMFGRPITAANRPMATGEALAHLKWLRAERRVARETDENGVDWYSRRD